MPPEHLREVRQYNWNSFVESKSCNRRQEPLSNASPYQQLDQVLSDPNSILVTFVNGVGVGCLFAISNPSYYAGNVALAFVNTALYGEVFTYEGDKGEADVVMHLKLRRRERVFFRKETESFRRFVKEIMGELFFHVACQLIR